MWEQWKSSLAVIFLWVLSAMAQAQQPLAGQQAAVVAEPEAPRVVLQAETTASVLRLMKFSGALRDRAGNARTGAVGLTFALYKDQQGGSPLWLEVQNAQLDEQGRYTVLLGSTKSEGLPLELFSTGEARWLGVQLNLPGEEEQARVLLVSVPYALKAADAETLGGKPPSAFLLADPVGADLSVRPEAGKEAAKEGPRREGVVGPINGEGSPNMVAKFTGANAIGNGSIFDNGNVGISTTSPNAKLSVGSGSIADANVPVQISTGGPGSITYYGANKGGGYGLLFGYEFGGSLGTGGVLRLVPPDPLLFYVNSSLEAMRITSTGNLGLGTSSPQAQLSVGSGSLLDTNVPVQISTGGTGTVNYYGANKNGGYGLLFGYENAGGLGTGGVLRMVAADPLLFVVNNTAEAMRITSAGNVGIGTAAPAEKLDVAGNIKATGNLTLSGSINGGLRVRTTAGTPNVIGGFSGNSVSGGVEGATISGGGGSFFPNSVLQNYGTVGGGQGNTAGGGSNATVGGGSFNSATGSNATVGGGGRNSAMGSNATVGGGIGNTASGIAATVPGGDSNVAGNYSFAAGRGAKANHDGAFVWGDSTNADIASTAPNQFLVRASGGASFLAGNVGIGTTTPLAKLSLGTDVANTKLALYDAPGAQYGFGIQGFQFRLHVGGPTDRFSFLNGAAGAEIMTIQGGGNVGIGTTTPTEKLHVVGNILATGTITPSARRLKTNIQPLAGALNKIERLRGVFFDWKESGKHDLGLIAEEVGEVLPEVVAYEENGVEAKGVDYARLTALLIEAVKEQQAQIRQLQLQVEQLKTGGSGQAAVARR